MKRFLPRLQITRWAGSDEWGEDATGWCLSVEWFGRIVELVGARRAAEAHRRCVSCGAEDDGTRAWTSKYVCATCESRVRRELGGGW